MNSSKTIKEYEYWYSKCMNFHFENLKEYREEIKIKFSFLKFINNQQTRSTQNKILAALKYQFNNMFEEEISYIENNIVWKKNVVYKKESLSQTQIDHILNNVKFTDDEKLACWIPLLTGARIEEVQKIIDAWLNSENKNNDKMILLITGKGSKPGKIYLEKTILELLNDLLNSKFDFVRFTNLHVRSITNFCNTGLKKCNICSGTHALRRTFATSLYRNGARIEFISFLLRHNDIRTTMEYIGICSDEIFDAIETIYENNFELINKNNFREKYNELFLLNQKQAKLIENQRNELKKYGN